MRLDHLLSKENILFLFCRLVGCLVRHLVVASFLSPHVGFACGGKFLFSGEDKYRTYFMCVVLGVDETKRGLCFRGFAGQQTCLCLVCDGLFCCVACCWVSRAARVLFYRSPLVGKIPDCWLVGVVCGVVCCVRTV